MPDTSGRFGWPFDRPLQRFLALSDTYAALGCVAVSLGLWLIVAFGYDLFGPFGSDPDIWLYSALNIGVGAPSVGPPGYPVLVELLRAPFGMEVASAGVIVSATSVVLLPGAVFLLVRDLAVSRGWAYLAAFAAMSPPVLQFGHQTQPDALITLLLVLSAWWSIRVFHRPRPRRWLWLAAFLGLLPLVREHAVVLAASMSMLLLYVDGTWKHRFARVGLLLLVWFLGVWFFGGDVRLPWEASWNSRVSMAVGEISNTQLPKYAAELTSVEAATLAHLHAAGDQPGIIRFHVAHSLRSNPAGWAWVVIGLLACLRAPRHAVLPLLAHLVVVVPTLFIWSQGRHVTVIIPLTMAVICCACSRSPKGFHWLLLFGLGWWCSGWAETAEHEVKKMQKENANIEQLKDFGRAFCALRTPGDLVAGTEYLATLYCPTPHHPVEKRSPIEWQGEGHAADWRTWYIGRGTLPHVWDQVSVGQNQFIVRRLRPDVMGLGRPCQNSFPPDDAPFLSLKAGAVVISPECGEMD